MEHDVTEIIRQKVKAAEEMPVTWRKDRVWQQIELKNPLEPHRTFYYAAAAVLVIMVSVGYLIQVSSVTSAKFRIRSLELALDKKLKEQSATRSISPSVPACKSDELPVVIRGRKKNLPVRVEVTKVVNPSFPEAKKISSEITAMKAVSDVPPQTDTPETTQPRFVKAIIGVVPERPQTIVKFAKRKGHIRLFRRMEGESEPYLASESKIITARIN